MITDHDGLWLNWDTLSERAVYGNWSLVISQTDNRRWKYCVYFGTDQHPTLSGEEPTRFQARRVAVTFVHERLKRYEASLAKR